MGLALLLLCTSAVTAQRRNLYSPSGDPSQPPADYVPDPGGKTASTMPPRYGSPYAGGYSGYGLTTTPSAPVIIQAPSTQGTVPYGSWGTPYYNYGYQSPAGSYLQGLASMTSATGQYYQQITQARITREQARQASIDTNRKQIEYEMWYESVRPTAPKMLKQEQATNLDWARNYAEKTEIWSGKTLNVLLQSVLRTPNPTQGPNIPLNDTALKGLNLTDGTTNGNLSLTKDEGKIYWTDGLMGEAFDPVRDRFSKNFEAATRAAHSSGPSRKLITGLNADLKSMEETLADQVAAMSPTDYIGARRLLNQLKDNVKGLGDPRLCKACHGDWRKNVKTVSELVGYCLKNGLQFGPAVAGDEQSYTITYYALRSYETALVGVALNK
jgi:hypothetical protein